MGFIAAAFSWFDRRPYQEAQKLQQYRNKYDNHILGGGGGLESN